MQWYNTQQANKSADKIANKKPTITSWTDPAGVPFNQQQLAWNDQQFDIREAMGRSMGEGFAPYMNEALKGLSGSLGPGKMLTPYGESLAPLPSPAGFKGRDYLDYLLKNPGWLDRPTALPSATLPPAGTPPGGQGGLVPAKGGGPSIPDAGYRREYTRMGGVAPGARNQSYGDSIWGGENKDGLPMPRMGNKPDLPPSFVDNWLNSGDFQIGPKGELIIKAIGAVIGYAVMGPQGAISGWRLVDGGVDKWNTWAATKGGAAPTLVLGPNGTVVPRGQPPGSGVKP